VAAGAVDRELLRRYHEHGDRRARELLIERHLPLVRALARRYAGRGEPVEDIEQVGAIGLIKAIDRFDLSRGVSLATFATPTVLGEIRRHFRDRGWAVRVPRALQELHAAVVAAVDRLGAELGRSPSASELARELGTSVEEVIEALELGSAYTPASLDQGGGDEDETDALAALGGEEPGYARSELRATLVPALKQLPRREREILQMRFTLGFSQAEIARRVGLSQMHVSRLIRRALQVLREEIG